MSPNKEEEQQKQEIKPVKNHSLVMGLACVTGIAALIIGIYGLKANQELKNQLQDANTRLSTQVQQLKQTQNSDQDQLNTKSATLQQSQTELQNKLDGINKQVQSGLNQKLYGSQDWLLLKVRYYLELAQINTYWTNDFKTSIAQLQEADKLLVELNQPKIYDLRQKIANEIALLNAIPALDITGLLSQLNAVQTSVGALNLQSDLDQTSTEATQEPAQSAGSSQWRSNLKQSLNLLEKLVVIRRDKEDIQPLMSPVFEAALKESIRLNIQEAQWALLNHNAGVYDLALKQATTNLQRIVNQGDQSASALIKQLQELQQIKFTALKPELGQALSELNKLIEHKGDKTL